MDANKIFRISAAAQIGCFAIDFIEALARLLGWSKVGVPNLQSIALIVSPLLFVLCVVLYRKALKPTQPGEKSALPLHGDHPKVPIRTLPPPDVEIIRGWIAKHPMGDVMLIALEIRVVNPRRRSVIWSVNMQHEPPNGITRSSSMEDYPYGINLLFYPRDSQGNLAGC